MATGTVYLDVDDEITSAAARIRGSEATKVALVVPYGSRIATSRMNFRLLSREAVVNNRRLSIVASDPATRALAASAGLPVFTSVGEYEAAAAAAGPGVDAPAASTVGEPVAIEGVAAEPAAAPKTTRVTKSRTKPAPPVPDDTELVALPPAAATVPPAAATVSPPRASAPTRPLPGAEASTAPAAAPSVAPPSSASSARIPITRSRRLPRVAAPVLVIAAVAILAVVVAGVGAYVFLPSAQISVTPREEQIGPIPLVVQADPDAASVDAANNVVPAIPLEVKVEVSDTFNATDKRVETHAASGEVTFQNFNFLARNTIPAGSVVSTEGGIKFKTVRGFTLAQAKLVLPGGQVIPSKGTIGVTAVTTGTAGNVPANSIRVVPPDENPDFTTVNNAEPTIGGSRQEFPRVGQADVDAAIAALRPRLLEAFNAQLNAGAGAPSNARVFPETAVLGEPVFPDDPQKLVGTETETFQVAATATGTVIAVDDSPVEQIARDKVVANVKTDYRLVDGSVRVERGDPSVVGGVVSFPVTARASQIPILDRDALLALVRGQPVADARAALAGYGEIEITTWPDWVATIPTIDSRVSLEIVGQDAAAGSSSPAPSGSGTP